MLNYIKVIFYKIKQHKLSISLVEFMLLLLVFKREENRIILNNNKAIYYTLKPKFMSYHFDL